MGNTTSRAGDTMRHDGLEAVTPTEAARRLGITPDAVRARLRRGTLPGELDGHEWRVFLLPEVTTIVDTPDPDRHDANTTRRAMRHDADTTTLTAVNTLIAAKDETITRLDAEVAYLREQLDHSRRELSSERERFDVIHREALQRIEALTAGEVRPEAERNSDGTPDGPSDAPGREEASQGLDSRDHPQSIVAGWLRRVFGRS